MGGFGAKAIVYTAAIAAGAGLGMLVEPWHWPDEAAEADTRAADARKAQPKAPPSPASPPRTSAPAAVALEHKAVRGPPGLDQLSRILAQSDALAERAKTGDAASALALLSAVNHCYPLQGQDPAALTACRRLPAEFVTNRAEILEAAVAADSAEAKLAYARTVIDVYRSDGFAMGRDLNDASAVGRLAEWYATQAARQGSKEAVAYLADAYLDGSFGVRDTAKSYGYLLVLRQAGAGAALDSAIDGLKTRLDASQTQEGEMIAREVSAHCCSREGSAGSP